VSISDIVNADSAESISANSAIDLVKMKMNPDLVKFKITGQDKQAMLSNLIKGLEPGKDAKEVLTQIRQDYINKKLTLKDATMKSALYKQVYGQNTNIEETPFSRAVRSSLQMFSRWSALTGEGAVSHAYDITRDLLSFVLSGNVKEDQVLPKARELLKGQIVARNPEVAGLDDVPNGVGSKVNGFEKISEAETKVKADKKITRELDLTEKVFVQIKTPQDLEDLKADRTELEKAGVDVTSILLRLGDKNGK